MRSPPSDAWLQSTAHLKDQIDLLQLEMAERKTALIELGEAEYLTNGGRKIQVIFPAPKISPDPDKIPELRQLVGPYKFDKLFESVTIWKPVKHCIDVAIALLPKKALPKFRELAEKDCAAQVRIT